MTKVWMYALGGAVFVGGGVALALSPNGGDAPCDPSLVLPRPLTDAAWAGVPGGSNPSLRITAEQLNCLGLGPVPLDDARAIGAALAAFATHHAAHVAAYRGSQSSVWKQAMVLDDTYRGWVGAPDAPDTVSPSIVSGSLRRARRLSR